MPATRRSRLAYAWAAPCSALGLLAALPAWVLGRARCRCVDGVLEVTPRQARGQGGVPRAWPGGFVAITFGHVVLACSAEHLEPLRLHEQAHVAQYERFGPLFLVAYPLASLWAGLCGRGAYRGNVFEVQARRAEALGEQALRAPGASSTRRSVRSAERTPC